MTKPCWQCINYGVDECASYRRDSNYPKCDCEMCESSTDDVEESSAENVDTREKA